MEQWKKEYNEKIIRNVIDPDLVKEIKQTIYEFYTNGYDRKRILLVLKAVFSKRISKPIIIEEFLSDIMNSYLDSITR